MSYELGPDYHTLCGYSALPSLAGLGTYEPADPAAQDEGMVSLWLVLEAGIHPIPKSDAQSAHSLSSQQATTQPVNVDSHFFESLRESQFGTSNSVKDGSDDGEKIACIHGDGREG